MHLRLVLDVRVTKYACSAQSCALYIMHKSNLQFDILEDALIYQIVNYSHAFAMQQNTKMSSIEEATNAGSCVKQREQRIQRRQQQERAHHQSESAEQREKRLRRWRIRDRARVGSDCQAKAA